MANIGTDILGLPTVVGGLSGTEQVPLVQGGTTKRAPASAFGLAAITEFFPAGVVYVMMGGTEVVPTGIQGTGVTVPFDCTITEVVANGDSPVGSAVLDIWKCTEADYDGGLTHPVVGDSITAGAKPTIVAGSKYTDTSLIGWTTTLTQGDVLWYNVDSVSIFRSITIALRTTRVF